MRQCYIFIQVFSRATSVNLMWLLCDDYKIDKYCKKIADFRRNVIIGKRSHNGSFLGTDLSHNVK